jgi:hypothetical protein
MLLCRATMARTTSLSRHALTFLSAVALGAALVGCTAHVSGGEPEGTGGGGGSSGSGQGGDSTTPYGGDGCTPGETKSCDGCTVDSMGNIIPAPATTTCEVDPSNPKNTIWNQATCGCGTPLVLSFDGARVEYLTNRDATFDIDGTRSQVTDWPTAKTPWLALDRNDSGTIDDGSELFGSMTVLSSGRRAKNGFEALRELDADGDGRITPADPGFARLLVWADHDGDRRASAGELAPAASWQILSIDLAYGSDRRCDARWNCEVERAFFQYRDANGVVRTSEVVDVHLAARQ